MPLKLNLKTVVVCLAIVSSLARAQDQDEAKGPRAEITVVPANVASIELDDAAVRELVGDTHDALEGGGDDHDLNFIQRLMSAEEWRERYNFRAIIGNALRYYAFNAENPVRRKHVLNLLTLLGTSHSIETVFGWTFGPPLLHSSNFLLKGLGTFLLSQSIPGLDLLCAFFTVTYARSPVTRKLVGTVRIALVSGVGWIFRQLRGDKLMTYLFQKQSVVDRLSEMLSKTEGRAEIVPLGDDVVINFGTADKPRLLTLVGKIEGEQLLWNNLQMAAELEGNEELQKEVLKDVAKMGWVTRDSVAALLRTLSERRPDSTDPVEKEKFAKVQRAFQKREQSTEGLAEKWQEFGALLRTRYVANAGAIADGSGKYVTFQRYGLLSKGRLIFSDRIQGKIEKCLVFLRGQFDSW